MAGRFGSNYRQRMGRKKKKKRFSEAPTSSSFKNWSMLPEDILIKILEKLSFLDFLHAMATCKGWKIQISSMLPWIVEQHWSVAESSSSSSSLSDRYLICASGKLHQPGNSDDQPYSTFRRSFELPCRGLSSFHLDPIVRDTKLGWMLVEIPSTGLLVHYNPFVDHDQARVLPPLLSLNKNVIIKAALSAPPTSSDCVVFVVTRIPGKNFATIHTWCPGDDVWKQHEGPKGLLLCKYKCSAVAMDGTLYCLEMGDSMLMVVFNSTNSSLKTVSRPMDSKFGHDGYLAAAVNGGEVLLVVYNTFRSRVGVFEVDEYDTAANSWAPKRRLDGLALFLDGRHPHNYCAYAAPAKMDNRVYLGFSKSEETYYSYQVDREMQIDQSNGSFIFPSYHQNPSLRRGDVFISMV